MAILEADFSKMVTGAEAWGSNSNLLSATNISYLRFGHGFGAFAKGDIIVRFASIS